MLLRTHPIMHFTQRMCCEHSGTRCQKTPQGGVHVQNRVTLTAPGIPTYYYAGDFIVFMLIGVCLWTSAHKTFWQHNRCCLSKHAALKTCDFYYSCMTCYFIFHALVWLHAGSEPVTRPDVEPHNHRDVSHLLVKTCYVSSLKLGVFTIAIFFSNVF